GGYVKMYGENIEDAVEVPLEEQHRSFSHKPTWARFLIVFAGPVFNFLFAFLIFWGMFAVTGVPHMTTEIGQVRENLPAAAAGLRAGDKILTIGGEKVAYWDDIILLVNKYKNQSVAVTVEREGRSLSFSVKPVIETAKNIFGEEIETPMIGIVARGTLVYQSINPIYAVYYGAQRTYDLSRLTIVSVIKIIQGVISPRTLGGPIFIAQLAGEQARAGIGNLIFLGALLSLNLGILNLLPVPVLDGGHLFFFSLEMIIRRPINLKVRERAQQAGIVFLILFMAFVFYNDLSRIFTGSEEIKPGKEAPKSAPAPPGPKAPAPKYDRSGP
ncbi:MAG: RIP metalloprotease RseP, partial [Pseudomonadota bacterium]